MPTRNMVALKDIKPGIVLKCNFYTENDGVSPLLRQGTLFDASQINNLVSRGINRLYYDENEL